MYACVLLYEQGYHLSTPSLRLGKNISVGTSVEAMGSVCACVVHEQRTGIIRKILAQLPRYFQEAMACA